MFNDTWDRLAWEWLEGLPCNGFLSRAKKNKNIRIRRGISGCVLPVITSLIYFALRLYAFCAEVTSCHGFYESCPAFWGKTKRSDKQTKNASQSLKFSRICNFKLLALLPSQNVSTDWNLRCANKPLKKIKINNKNKSDKDLWRWDFVSILRLKLASFLRKPGTIFNIPGCKNERKKRRQTVEWGKVRGYVQHRTNKPLLLPPPTCTLTAFGFEDDACSPVLSSPVTCQWRCRSVEEQRRCIGERTRRWKLARSLSPSWLFLFNFV